MSSVKDENIDIAKRLLRVRQDYRLSQEQFAQSLGVTRQEVLRWEMGISIPSHSTLKQISEIYEVWDAEERMKGLTTRLVSTGGWRVRSKPNWI